MSMYFLDGRVGICFLFGGSVKWVLTFHMQVRGCGMSFWTKNWEDLEISTINNILVQNV